MFIYLVTNKLNGLRYVGKTTQVSVALRWAQHCYEAKKYNSPYPFHQAIVEHGIENFEVSVLFRTSCEQTLANKELEFTLAMKTHLPAFGYNKKIGTKFSPGMREKLSLARQGQIFSASTRKKMSEARKGRAPWNAGKIGTKMPPWSQERREKTVASLKKASSFLTQKRGYGGMVYSGEPNLEEELRRKEVREGVLVESRKKLVEHWERKRKEKLSSV